jgi:hypothetical protein
MEQVLLIIHGFTVHSRDYKDRVTLVIIVMFIVLCLFKCFVLCIILCFVIACMTSAKFHLLSRTRHVLVIMLMKNFVVLQ